jgi:outer membrane protein TolC
MKFSVQQPLFLGYRIRGAIDQSAAALEAVLGDRDRKVQQVSAAIETAYWTAAGAREAATVFAEYVTQAKRHQEDARNYLAQGLVTRNDLLKAEMRVSGAETQRLDADTAFVAARMRLNLLLGFPWDAPTETEALPDGDASGAMAFTGKDVDTLLSAGLSARRELDSARSRIKADQAAFAVARAPLYPNVFATGDVAIAEPNQRFFPQLNEFKTTWSAGILVSIDAGKVPATMAQVEQASARLRRDTEALSAMEDTVTREIVTAYLDLQKSRQQVLNARTLLAQAEESIRTTRDLFDKGVALGADVSDAEAALLAARLQQVSARIAVLNSAASLRLAVGQAGTGNR